MKDSGVAWIGEVPKEWAVLRGKDIFAKRSLPAFDTDEIVTCFRDGQVTLRKNRREDGFTIALKEHGYQGVRVGDLVVHAMDAFAGAIGISESNGKCSPVYSICRARHPTKTDLRFYSYVLRDMALNGYIQSVGQGIRERSTDFRFREVEVAFYCQPTPAEQLAIADYLDQQTALIDQRLTTLAEKKTVLAELRKATIHEAVTKGLNKTAPMKDSENLFIGKIPAHWAIRRIKKLSTKIGSGKTPLGGSSVYVPEGVMFLRSQNVWDEGLFLDDVVYIAETVDKEMKGSRIKVGDILINVTGASIGRTCLVPDGVVANVNQHVCIVRLRNKKFASFVARAMQAYATQRQIAEVQVGAAREGLNFEQIGNLFVVFPPPDEQRAIADHLDQQTQQFDAQLATLDEQAQVLKELRKAIIHEAVTGKIDLSGTTPPQTPQALAA